MQLDWQASNTRRLGSLDAVRDGQTRLAQIYLEIFKELAAATQVRSACADVLIVRIVAHIFHERDSRYTQKSCYRFLLHADCLAGQNLDIFFGISSCCPAPWTHYQRSNGSEKPDTPTDIWPISD